MRVAPPLALGSEAVPLNIVDDAHPDPDALCRVARSATFARAADDLYPGIRAAPPEDYATWLERTIGSIGAIGPVQVIRTCFAIATDAPTALAPIQRIPHFDTVDADVVAAVHYLCRPPQGGTSFYRHRRTGYERIDATRQGAWRQALVQDARRHRLPDASYAGDGDESFERIGQADLRFNRLILYPANCLHAGDIGRGALSASPEDGRLTLTSLVRVAARDGHGNRL